MVRGRPAPRRHGRVRRARPAPPKSPAQPQPGPPATRHRTRRTGPGRRSRNRPRRTATSRTPPQPSARPTRHRGAIPRWPGRRRDPALDTHRLPDRPSALAKVNQRVRQHLRNLCRRTPATAHHFSADGAVRVRLVTGTLADYESYVRRTGANPRRPTHPHPVRDMARQRIRAGDAVLAPTPKRPLLVRIRPEVQEMLRRSLAELTRPGRCPAAAMHVSGRPSNWGCSTASSPCPGRSSSIASRAAS